MKKILFTILMVIALASVAFSATEEELVPIKNNQNNSGQLVDIETRRSSSKVDDLERRIRDLERAQRTTEDRVRDLDRQVSDLRRRSF
jgi:hypothetical protein